MIPPRLGSLQALEPATRGREQVVKRPAVYGCGGCPDPLKDPENGALPI